MGVPTSKSRSASVPTTHLTACAGGILWPARQLAGAGIGPPRVERPQNPNPTSNLHPWSSRHNFIDLIKSIRSRQNPTGYWELCATLQATNALRHWRPDTPKNVRRTAQNRSRRVGTQDSSGTGQSVLYPGGHEHSFTRRGRSKPYPRGWGVTIGVEFR